MPPLHPHTSQGTIGSEAAYLFADTEKKSWLLKLTNHCPEFHTNGHMILQVLFLRLYLPLTNSLFFHEANRSSKQRKLTKLFYFLNDGTF